MKAIAVKPGIPNTVHLTELPAPNLSDVPNGRGVLVRVLRVGVDGTDKEINAADYGQAPEGYDFLVIGHEGFGRVVADTASSQSGRRWNSSLMSVPLPAPDWPVMTKTGVRGDKSANPTREPAAANERTAGSARCADGRTARPPSSTG